MPHLPCPATPEFVGVAGFFCCRMTLPLWYPVGGACPRRHLLFLPLWYPEGGLPTAALAIPATVVPGGGLAPGGTCYPCHCGTLWGACPLCHPPTLPLVCLFAPYPPNPLPRRGRGRFFCFLMQGASPLASPAFNRLRHLQSLPLWYPVGGLPSLPPAYPAFGLISCPLSPQPPSPAGKGENITLFRRGLRPPAPLH